MTPCCRRNRRPAFRQRMRKALPTFLSVPTPARRRNEDGGGCLQSVPVGCMNYGPARMGLSGEIYWNSGCFSGRFRHPNLYAIMRICVIYLREMR